jgi:hypothetical protein
MMGASWVKCLAHITHLDNLDSFDIIPWVTQLRESDQVRSRTPKRIRPTW